MGVEAFAARAVQAPQQQVKAMPQRLGVALLPVPRGQQFQDHALQRGHVIRQFPGGGGGHVSSGGVGGTHPYLTHHRSYVFFEGRKKTRPRLPFRPTM
jgi:hypothetical protein